MLDFLFEAMFMITMIAMIPIVTIAWAIRYIRNK